MKIRDIENALILVGKNNTGKTSVLDAIRMVTGSRQVRPEDFNEKLQNIEIEVELEITGEDLSCLLYTSQYRFDICLCSQLRRER